MTVAVAAVVMVCCVILDVKLISNRVLAFVVPILSIVLGTMNLFWSRTGCQNQTAGLTSLRLWVHSGGVGGGLMEALAVGGCILSIAVFIDIAPAYSVAWRGVGISILGTSAFILVGGYLGAMSSVSRS